MDPNDGYHDYQNFDFTRFNAAGSSSSSSTLPSQQNVTSTLMTSTAPSLLGQNVYDTTMNGTGGFEWPAGLSLEDANQFLAFAANQSESLSTSNPTSTSVNHNPPITNVNGSPGSSAAPSISEAIKGRHQPYRSPQALYNVHLQQQHLNTAPVHFGANSSISTWSSPSPSSSTTPSAVHTPQSNDQNRPSKHPRLHGPSHHSKLPVTYPTSSPPIELIHTRPTKSPSYASASSLNGTSAPKKHVQFKISSLDTAHGLKPRLRRALSDPLLSSLRIRSAPRHKLASLFNFLDERAWSVQDMLECLSEIEEGDEEHTRRMQVFLMKEERVGKIFAGLEEVYARLVKTREKLSGAQGVEAFSDEANRAHAAEQHGSIIRNILTKDSAPYEEAQADIKMIDAALSRGPSPGTLARTYDPNASSQSSTYTGRLVVPSIQADILGEWLMSPGRPALADERDSITPEHMRIYSSLSPLELHARGAELCRVVLTRDRNLKLRFGTHAETLESFLQGPRIAPSRRCGFHDYDDYSLWHHALMTYLQVCTRYPSFRDSKPTTIDIVPDQSTLPPTLLESSLIERALESHWNSFRLYLLEEGGLLRRAVKAFSGVKTRPLDLLLICDDASVVMNALKKSLKEPERILPYDPRISEARNEWRQSAYWSEGSHLMMWSAATTHFLEISALYPKFSEGVRELPGLEGLLKSASGAGSG